MSAEEPITLIFRRRVKRGSERAFEEWVRGITQAALQFLGHRGAGILRPGAGQRPEYTIVFRFDSLEHARQWEDSEVRAEWVARVGAFTEGEAQIERVSGLEFWFTPPPGMPAPPRWKMAVVSGLMLWPLNSLFSFLLYPWIGNWPIPLRALVIVGLLVPVMTYVAMPLATRLFAKWLYPSQQP